MNDFYGTSDTYPSGVKGEALCEWEIPLQREWSGIMASTIPVGHASLIGREGAKISIRVQIFYVEVASF